MSERIIVSKTGYGKTAKFYEDLIKETIEEKDKEIERLNKELEFEKLKNKEVREYIENKWNCNFSEICKKHPQKLLEILDKVGSDKE